MQINQQICRKMEELEKMEENNSDMSKVQGVCTRLPFCLARFQALRAWTDRLLFVAKQVQLSILRKGR